MYYDTNRDNPNPGGELVKLRPVIFEKRAPASKAELFYAIAIQ